MLKARSNSAVSGAHTFSGTLFSRLRAVLRIGICMLLASVVTAALFYFDSVLVRRPQAFDTGVKRAKLVDFVRVQEQQYLVTKKRMPKKPPPPDAPPPPPKIQIAANDMAPPMDINMDIPAIDIPMGGGNGPFIGSWSSRTGDKAMDGDVIPIVRIEPQYPREALLKGMEGWVRLAFTIQEDGSVCDVAVVEAEPARVFNRNAVRAVLRWKFKPRIVDGQPVRRQGQQVIEFKLDADLDVESLS
jgi:protein TonB